jgi:aspartate aminotransferase
MTIAERVKRVKKSITMEMTAKAKTMAAEGIDVIALSAGEPDFDTPEHIRAAGIEAIRSGFTKYTESDGMPDLKKAVCRTFERENGLVYTPNQVIVNSGAKHSVYLIIMALINPGDEVIIPSPYWVSYPDMVRLADGVPVFIPTDASQGLKITPEQLRNAITPRTRLLIFNSPSNPSGTVYSAQEMRALGEVLEGTGIMVLSDEIYSKLSYDGNAHVAFASLSDDLYNRTVTVNGVSKSYSMTGWRIGYSAGPVDVIKAMGTVQSQEISNPTSISQKAALAALNSPQEFFAEWLEEFSRRRLFVVDRLNALEGISCIVPGGAFYAFPDVSALYGRRAGEQVIDGSLAFCDYMLNEQHIAIVPGIGFGNDRHIRISYAVSMEI